MVSSAQWWLMPPIEGVNSIADRHGAGHVLRVVPRARWACAARGPAPGFPPPRPALPSSPHRRGAGSDLLMFSSVAVVRSRRLLSCTQARRRRSIRSSTATSMSRNWNRMSALPGDDARRHRARPRCGPRSRCCARRRSSGIPGRASPAAAPRPRPASRRSAMVVPPAWSCMPSMAMRHCQMATMPVTTPSAEPGALQLRALLDCISKKPLCRPGSSCIRGLPASPAAASASRSGVPSVRLRLRSISSSGSRPRMERLPRKPPSKCPSSSAKATTSTGRPDRARRARRRHRARRPASRPGSASRYGCRPADAARAPCGGHRHCRCRRSRARARSPPCGPSASGGFPCPAANRSAGGRLSCRRRSA